MASNSFFIFVFVPTISMALWQMRGIFRDTASGYLGAFTAFFALSNLHLLNVNMLFQEGQNFLVFIPLNLVFFPLYFVVVYFEKILFIRVFPRLIQNLILFVSFLELTSGLLPLGAWIYSQQFDARLISFMFGVKRFFVIALFLFGVAFFVLCKLKLRGYEVQDETDTLRINLAKEINLLLIILVLLIELPEIAHFLQFQSHQLYTIQAVFGGGIVLFIGFRNGNVQEKLAGEKVEEDELKTSVPATQRKFSQIEHLFEGERVFLNPNLKISDIAQILSLSPNYTSKIIKENAKIGFNEFVNQYRVEEVIEKLKKKQFQNKTIFALAQEAGFKSKSTFQIVFKKVTGKTPTEYIEVIESRKEGSYPTN